MLCVNGFMCMQCQWSCSSADGVKHLSIESFTDGPFFLVWRAFLKGAKSWSVCFPTTCDLSSELQLAHDTRQQSGWVSPSECSLRVCLGKADVPARLLPRLPVHSPELESWSDICLLTPFILTGLNICDTYSEFKIAANTSKGKLAMAAVAVRDVPYVWVSV